MIITAVISVSGLFVLNLLHMLGMVYVPTWLAWSYILMVTCGLFIEISRDKELCKLGIIFLIAYVARIAVLICDVYLRDYITIFGSGKDTERFYRNMVAMALGNQDGTPYYYATAIGWLFKRIGISRVLAQYINVLFSTMALYYTYRAMACLKVDFVFMRNALFIMAIMPNNICMSAILLRESPIYLFVALSLYCFAQWYVCGGNGYFLMSIMLTIPAFLLHTGIVGMTVGIILVRLIYDRQNCRFKFSVWGIAVGGIALFAFVFLYNNYADILFPKLRGIESITDISSGEAAGNSSYAQYVGDSSTPLRMLIFTLPRIFYLVFSPLPWQWRGLNDIIAFMFNAVIYIYIIVNMMRIIFARTKNFHDNNIMICVALVILPTLFIYSWGTINSGTALRHRDKLLPLFILLLALINSSRKKKSMLLGNVCE